VQGADNTSFPKCFARIPPPLLPWRKVHLVPYGPTLAYKLSRSVSYGLFPVGILKTGSISKVLMPSRITFERRSGEFSKRWWTGSLQTSMCEQPLATVIQRPGAWIEHIINYWAAITKLWCTRKIRTRRKPRIHASQANEKWQSFPFNRKRYLVKTGCLFLDHPVNLKCLLDQYCYYKIQISTVFFSQTFFHFLSNAINYWFRDFF